MLRISFFFRGKVLKPRTSALFPSHDYTTVWWEFQPFAQILRQRRAQLLSNSNWLKDIWEELAFLSYDCTMVLRKESRCHWHWTIKGILVFFFREMGGAFGPRFLLSNLMMILFYLQWTVHSLHDAKTHSDEWMKCDFLVIFLFSFRLMVGVMCVLVTKFTGCPAFSTSFGCWNTLYDF